METYIATYWDLHTLTYQLKGLRLLGVSLSSKSIIMMPCFVSFQDTTFELAGVPVKDLLKTKKKKKTAYNLKK